MPTASTPPKKYHNRAFYLNAAFDLIRDIGIDRLTMRRLAEYLDVSAMAIYKHFGSKDELLKAVLDEFIARADVIPPARLPWPEWVGQLARGMFRALQGETAWLPLLGSFDIGENALRVTTSFIDRLMQEGLDFEQAVEAYLTMIHLVIGAVTLQATFEKSMAAVAQTLAQEKNVSARPILAMVNRDQIELGLPLFIAGLEARLATAGRVPL